MTHTIDHIVSNILGNGSRNNAKPKPRVYTQAPPAQTGIEDMEFALPRRTTEEKKGFDPAKGFKTAPTIASPETSQPTAFDLFGASRGPVGTPGSGMGGLHDKGIAPVETSGLPDYWDWSTWGDRAKDIARPFLPGALQGGDSVDTEYATDTRKEPSFEREYPTGMHQTSPESPDYLQGIFDPIVGAFQALEDIMSPIWGKTATIKGLSHLSGESQEILKIRHETLIDAGLDTTTAWAQAWQGALDAGEIPLSEQIQQEFWVDPLWIIPPVKIVKTATKLGKLGGGKGYTAISKFLSKNDPDLMKGRNPAPLEEHYSPITPAKPPKPIVGKELKELEDVLSDDAAPLVKDAINKASEFSTIDGPGFLGRFIEQTPGLKQAMGVINRTSFIPEHIRVAMVAENGVRAEFGVFAKADPVLGRHHIIDEINKIFGEGASKGKKTEVRFTGGTDDVAGIESTVFDIAQRPHLYELSKAQREFLTQWRNRNDEIIKTVKNGFGVRMGVFDSPHNGVFLSNVNAARKHTVDIAHQLDSENYSAVLGGRKQTRYYETAAQRIQAESARGIPESERFVPQLDIEILQAGMDNSKATFASQEVFMNGSGGMSYVQAMDIVNPGLRRYRDELAARVQGLRNRINNAEQTGKATKRKLIQADTEIRNSKKRAEPMLERIEGIGDKGADVDPELSYLSGQIRELMIIANKKANKGVVLSERMIEVGKKKRTMLAELDSLSEKLTDVRKKYKAAGLENKKTGISYERVNVGTKDAAIYKYYTSDNAKAIREVTRKPEGLEKWIIDFVETVRGTAFAGDLSPIAGIQLPIFAIFHPVKAVSRIVGTGLDSIRSRDAFRAFREDTMMKAVSEDVQGYRDLAFWSGNPIAGDTPTEFSGGLLKMIPGFSTANRSMYMVVQRQMKSAYDLNLKLLAQNNITGNTAKAVAADAATMVTPLWNPSRFALSPARAAALRALPTSISFITRPAALMHTATTGFVKMGMKQPLTPNELLAVRLAINYAATSMTLSLTTHVLDALERGVDPWEAAKRAINPMSPTFGDVMVPFTGRRILLGGPYRGLIRAIVPRQIKGKGVPVPFAGIPNYAKNRITPAVQTQVRLARNRDFYGGEILKGNFSEQIFRGLMYEFEGMAPLTIGSGIGGIRRGLSVAGAAEEAGATFFGQNIDKEMPYQAMNTEVEQWAADRNLPEKYGREVKSFSDLGPADQNLYSQEHPESVAALDAENARRAKQGIPKAVAWAGLQNIKANRFAEEEGLAEELFMPPTNPDHATPDVFRKRYSDIQAKAAHQMASHNKYYHLWKEDGDLPENANDRALVQFYNAFDESKTEGSNVLVYDVLNEKMSELEDNVWTEAQKKWVDENTGLFDNHPPLIQEYLTDRSHSDVKKWNNSIYEYMEKLNLLELYRLWQHSTDRTAFVNMKENIKLRVALRGAKKIRDEMRSGNANLERLLYKWGYIDSPSNRTIAMAVDILRSNQDGHVTNRLEIDNILPGLR